MSSLLESVRRSSAPDLLAGPLRAAGGLLLRERGCLLTFHRATSAAGWAQLPHRDFHVNLDFLNRVLGYLLSTGWDIVTLDDALERLSSPERGGRFANFSIDDCYRDTFEEVVPLFRRHRAPVTLFVTTGIPDETVLLRDAGLEAILLSRDRVRFEDGGIDVPTREAKGAAFKRISSAWEGRDGNRLYAEFCRSNGEDHAELDRRFAITWDMLAALRDDPLVEIGAHGVSHARISALGIADAAAEIAGSRERLRSRLGLPVRHFAFPYGRQRDCGPRDFDLARKAGFASAATTRKGLARRGADPFRLPRNTLNGSDQSLAVVEAHLIGLTGLAAGLSGRV